MNIDNIYIEITNQCNLSCSYCYNSSKNQLKVVELSIDDLNNIIAYFVQLGVNKITFSGGEPTLHSNYKGLFHLIDYYSDIKFIIITNGTIFHNELYEKIKKYENLHFQISLDGASEERNRITRGKNNFALSLETVEKLKDSFNSPILKMVVSNENVKNIDEFISLAKKYSCVPVIEFVTKLGRAANMWETIKINFNERAKVNQKIEHYYKSNNINFEETACIIGCPLVDLKYPQNMLIKPDGSIQPCQQLYDSSFCIGNALELESLNNLSGSIKRIQQLAIKRRETDYDCCNCIIRSVCDKGCMAQAFNEFDDYLANDGECKRRRTQTAQVFLKKYL